MVGAATWNRQLPIQELVLNYFWGGGGGGGGGEPPWHPAPVAFNRDLQFTLVSKSTLIDSFVLKGTSGREMKTHRRSSGVPFRVVATNSI